MSSRSDAKPRITNPKILTAIELEANVFYFAPGPRRQDGLEIIPADRAIYRKMTCKTLSEVNKAAVEEFGEWDLIALGPGEFAVYLPWLRENRNWFISFALNCWVHQARKMGWKDEALPT